MPQPQRRQSVSSRRTSYGKPASGPPTWLIPLVALMVVLIVVAVAVVSCQGCAQPSPQPEAPAAEEGVKTIDEALVAGGLSARGDADIATAFAAYSWDELKAIAGEIASSSSSDAAAELAKKYRLVNAEGKLTGDCKPLTWPDGSSGAVQIAGFYHDDKADGSGKAGITFITKDSLPEKQYMNASGNNDGGWELSDLRVALQETGMSHLPAEVGDKIVAVSKATNNVGLTNQEDVVTLTSDELWLYSKVELCTAVAYATPTPLYNNILAREGTQYQLFADASVADKEMSPLLLKKNGNDAFMWWTRSPMPDINTGNGYFVVLKAGVTDDFAYFPDNKYGVVLGFCF